MSEITMDFARQDDCLDRMVPSDLRVLIGERDALAADNARLRAELSEVADYPDNDSVEMRRIARAALDGSKRGE